MVWTRSLFLIGAIVALLPFLSLSAAFSEPAPITAKELMENSALKAHVQELKSGEIVLMTQPANERANQLNVVMAVLVPASLEKTVDTLQRQATAEDGPGILAIGEIKTASASGVDKALDGVSFTVEEAKEVEKLMAVGPGEDFNFSQDEMAMIKKRADGVKKSGKDAAAAAKVMSLALRNVLKGRYLAYREGGLEGLAPYQTDSTKQIHPSQELISATESLHLLKERFSQYYECLRFYPQKQPVALAHQFFWAKQMESGRPLFLLKHWMLDVEADYALITERRFYLNHSLNSLQVVIGCLPHNDRTLVVLLNQAFTEKVNMAIGKTIAKKIGYHEVEKNIRPMFENLQAALRP